MKLYLVLIVVYFSNACSLLKPYDQLLIDWESFKSDYGKDYANSDLEVKRFFNWYMNTKYIEQHNAAADAGKYTFWVGMNQFGDLVS